MPVFLARCSGESSVSSIVMVGMMVGDVVWLERMGDGLPDGLPVDARELLLDGRLAVLDKGIRDADDGERDPDVVLRQQLGDSRAESPCRLAFLDGDEVPVLHRFSEDEL